MLILHNIVGILSCIDRVHTTPREYNYSKIGQDSTKEKLTLTLTNCLTQAMLMVDLGVIYHCIPRIYQTTWDTRIVSFRPRIHFFPALFNKNKSLRVIQT